jgi:hypothetical protein
VAIRRVYLNKGGTLKGGWKIRGNSSCRSSNEDTDNMEKEFVVVRAGKSMRRSKIMWVAVVRLRVMRVVVVRVGRRVSPLSM